MKCKDPPQVSGTAQIAPALGVVFPSVLPLPSSAPALFEARLPNGHNCSMKTGSHFLLSFLIRFYVISCITHSHLSFQKTNVSLPVNGRQMTIHKIASFWLERLKGLHWTLCLLLQAQGWSMRENLAHWISFRLSYFLNKDTSKTCLRYKVLFSIHLKVKRKLSEHIVMTFMNLGTESSDPITSVRTPREWTGKGDSWYKQKYIFHLCLSFNTKNISYWIRKWCCLN